jgi:hypothetical protein
MTTPQFLAYLNYVIFRFFFWFILRCFLHDLGSSMKMLGSLAFKCWPNVDNKRWLNINAQNYLHYKVRLSLHLHMKFAKYLLYVVQLFFCIILDVFLFSLVNMKLSKYIRRSWIVFVCNCSSLWPKKSNIKLKMDNSKGY